MYLLLCGGMGLGVQGGIENVAASDEAIVIEPTTLVALRAAEAKALLRVDAENAMAHTNRCFAQQERRWREKYWPKPAPVVQEKSRFDRWAELMGFAVWSVYLENLGGNHEQFE
jgi:hypothetical protein